MTLTTRSRLAIFLGLGALMAATRLNHFGAIPDASWAAFFIAGFYLRGSVRWAFPALMAIAVAVDYAVITAGGQSFWSHYCVSPGYWFLVPAHLSMWFGGSLLRRHYGAGSFKTLGLLLVSVFASTAACHSLICTPRPGKPKKIKNSCTRNGVLRINSTYNPNNAAKGRIFHARTTAPTIPRLTPNTVPIAVSSRVNRAPRNNRSLFCSTGKKSN